MLPANLVQFARLLRRAGLPVGPAAVVTAGHALAAPAQLPTGPQLLPCQSLY